MFADALKDREEPRKEIVCLGTGFREMGGEW